MRIFITLAIIILSGGTLLAQQPTPPTNLKVADFVNDAGDRLQLTWNLSEDDPALDGSDAEDASTEDVPAELDNPIIQYRIDRQTSGDSEFEEVGTVDAGIDEYVAKELEQQKYTFRVIAIAADGSVSVPSETASGTPIVQWIDKSKIAFGIFMLIVCGSVVYFIEMAKAGRTLNVRKIAGLEAIEEAVGRATEMGRDCLFVPGIQDINDIQTVAGITVLSRVAELTAEYDAGLDVPTTRSLVMTTARETVEGAYTAAGRPDLYNPDNIYYLTDEQFGFVAAVTGKMVREKPAACFYMGAFYAESLIFAETANTVGAIQIAGTAMPSQLPFFVAACDYVLIGEEFFAASAYLSGEPQQLGSLKGQDVGKFIAAIFLIVGAVLMTVGEFISPGSEGEGSGMFREVILFIKDGLLGN
ncbi:MAG: fibronectin type III domain-containing protein [Planctomycetaceae bacterium]|nr:fibronectin type III domain-containing protein [Planctomycetaceae bacterium]